MFKHLREYVTGTFRSPNRVQVLEVAERAEAVANEALKLHQETVMELGKLRLEMQEQEEECHGKIKHLESLLHRNV